MLPARTSLRLRRCIILVRNHRPRVNNAGALHRPRQRPGLAASSVKAGTEDGAGGDSAVCKLGRSPLLGPTRAARALVLWRQGKAAAGVTPRWVGQPRPQLAASSVKAGTELGGGGVSGASKLGRSGFLARTTPACLLWARAWCGTSCRPGEAVPTCGVVQAGAVKMIPRWVGQPRPRLASCKTSPVLPTVVDG